MLFYKLGFGGGDGDTSPSFWKINFGGGVTLFPSPLLLIFLDFSGEWHDLLMPNFEIDL